MSERSLYKGKEFSSIYSQEISFYSEVKVMFEINNYEGNNSDIPTKK